MAAHTTGLVTSRANGVSIEFPVRYGSVAFELGVEDESRVKEVHVERGRRRPTHRWYCYLRPASEADAGVFYSLVTKVVFRLDKSFGANRDRIITQPPFQLDEVGWGEFVLDIDVHVDGRVGFLQHLVRLRPYVVEAPPVDILSFQEMKDTRMPRTTTTASTRDLILSTSDAAAVAAVPTYITTVGLTPSGAVVSEFEDSLIFVAPSQEAFQLLMQRGQSAGASGTKGTKQPRTIWPPIAKPLWTAVCEFLSSYCPERLTLSGVEACLEKMKAEEVDLRNQIEAEKAVLEGGIAVYRKAYQELQEQAAERRKRRRETL